VCLTPARQQARQGEGISHHETSIAATGPGYACATTTGRSPDRVLVTWDSYGGSGFDVRRNLSALVLGRFARTAGVGNPDRGDRSCMDPTPHMSIAVSVNGPYLVSGNVPLSTQTIVADTHGDAIDWHHGAAIDHQATFALCRCGQSANKPFSDGAHVRVGFDGTETASNDTYQAQATVQIGPTLSLSDAPALCAGARFCDAGGQVWNLVEQSGPDAAAMTVREAGLCPSGRLVAAHPDTGPTAPQLAPSLGIVQDPSQGVAGPIWVRGGIPIRSSDGATYEVRNRVTLCRCGASANKPFCDASHVTIRFTD
jgi:CDGSH-type Zn-finger protein